ncbi:hypothetical protein F0562_032698 [Nyssa sinensis]|uniref:Uncharacterized protein n=1 Tax=Nyssa sinensis TaxID=561372 RepID=A0A5J5ANG9_9ASTE|nr:hypothetical protein F0562_032698 [Nyssa sinensis]
MAWFSGKVSLGNFPDLAGPVNKISESVKSIEKNLIALLVLRRSLIPAAVKCFRSQPPLLLFQPFAHLVHTCQHNSTTGSTISKFLLPASTSIRTPSLIFFSLSTSLLRLSILLS